MPAGQGILLDNRVTNMNKTEQKPALKLQWGKLIRKAITLGLYCIIFFLFYCIIINKIFCEYRQGTPNSHQNGCDQKTSKKMLTHDNTQRTKYGTSGR